MIPKLFKVYNNAKKTKKQKKKQLTNSECISYEIYF